MTMHFVLSAMAGLMAAMALQGAGPAQIESRRAAAEATGDTDPNSEFWRGVPGVFIETDALGNPAPGYRSEVRSRWTAGNLYLLFVCPYEQLNLKPNPSTATETNQLWNWDVAEAFIGHDFQNIRQYKEFELSPQGEWVDLDIDRDHPKEQGGVQWNSGFQVAARIDGGARVWYGFMRIPYASIDPHPAAAGNLLRINFYRAQAAAPERKLLSWRPTGKNNFHVPEAFGTMKLVE